MRFGSAILLIAGVILGVLSAAPTPESHVGLALSFGLLLAGLSTRRSSRRVPTDDSVVHPPRARQVEEAILRVASLASKAETLSLLEIRDRIEQLMTGPLFALTWGEHGLLRYPDSTLAARLAVAERRLNRCWSAAVDGCREEVLAALPEASRMLEEALAHLQAGRVAKN